MNLIEKSSILYDDKKLSKRNDAEKVIMRENILPK